MANTTRTPSAPRLPLSSTQMPLITPLIPKSIYLINSNFLKSSETFHIPNFPSQDPEKNKSVNGKDAKDVIHLGCAGISTSTGTDSADNSCGVRGSSTPCPNFCAN